MFEQGRPLSALEREIFEPYFEKNVLDSARIVDGKVPFWLSQNMCAVVLGHRVYFRAGHYQPNTRRGIELLGHELTHVSQYLQGMTILKYLWSCRHGYYKSVYEMEAYTKGRLIANNYLATSALKS
jgi:hypothetical protein